MKVQGRWFYYEGPECQIIRIWAKRRPSLWTRPRSGVWPCHEIYEGQWVCVWEIKWWKLRRLKYIGSMKVET